MTLSKVINILLALSILAAIVVLLWYILGNSPTPEQLLITAVLPLYLLVFYTREKLNEKIYNTRESLLKEISDTREKLSGEISEIKNLIRKK